MKRIVTLGLFLLCLLGLSACAEKEQTAGALAFYHAERGTEISLGMTRKEVESQLGTGLAGKDENDLVYGEGADALGVYYDVDEGTLVTLSNYSPSVGLSSAWTLQDAIGVGASREEIEKVFGVGVLAQVNAELSSTERAALWPLPHGEEQTISMSLWYALSETGAVLAADSEEAYAQLVCLLDAQGVLVSYALLLAP